MTPNIVRSDLWESEGGDEEEFQVEMKYEVVQTSDPRAQGPSERQLQRTQAGPSALLSTNRLISIPLGNPSLPNSSLVGKGSRAVSSSCGTDQTVCSHERERQNKPSVGVVAASGCRVVSRFGVICLVGRGVDAVASRMSGGVPQLARRIRCGCVLPIKIVCYTYSGHFMRVTEA